MCAIDLASDLLRLQAAGKLLPGWQTQLSVSRSTDAYDTLASASAFATLGRIETRQTQIGWENRIATPVGTALVLAERLQQDVSRPGAPFSVSDRSIDAVGLGLNGSSGGHLWQAALRHDRNSQFGGQTTGALAYALQWTPAWRAGLSYGTSFVAPSFNQLYFPGFGNPNLLPEEGRQREVGLVWRNGPVTSRLAYFDNRIRGYISGGPLPTNIPQSSFEGLSASLETQQGPWLLTAALDLNDPTNQTNAASTFGKQLPRRVRESARLAADWREGAWSAGASVVAFGPSFENAANTQRLSGFAVVDARLDWKLSRQLNLGLRLGNITLNRC
jgi:vitamin B12 transporter